VSFENRSIFWFGYSRKIAVWSHIKGIKRSKPLFLGQASGRKLLAENRKSTIDRLSSGGKSKRSKTTLNPRMNESCEKLNCTQGRRRRRSGLRSPAIALRVKCSRSIYNVHTYEYGTAAVALRCYLWIIALHWPSNSICNLCVRCRCRSPLFRFRVTLSVSSPCFVLLALPSADLLERLCRMVIHPPQFSKTGWNLEQKQNRGNKISKHGIFTTKFLFSKLNL